MIKEFKFLLLNTIAQRFITIYSTLFLNFYFWQENQSIQELTYFNIILLLSWNVSYWFGTKLLVYINLRFLMGLSSIFSLISYSILILPIQVNFTILMTIVAIPLGIFNGFYFCSKNLSINVAGNKNSYQTFFSYTTIITHFVSIFTPVFSAILIVLGSYNLSFIYMILCSILLIFTSLKIPIMQKETINEKEKNINFKNLFNNKPLKLMLLSFVLAGMFRQFQSFFVILFTFTVTQNEIWIATLNVSYVLITFLCMKIYEKTKKQQTQHRWLYIGFIFITTGYGFVLIPYQPLLIVANIFTTIGMFYFNTIFVSQHFTLIKEQSEEKKPTLFLYREVITNSFRILMLLMIFFIDNVYSFNFVSILLISLLAGGLIPLVQKKTFSKHVT